jgi:hypothetical protein
MTATEIVNAALTRCGCNPISALGDTTLAEGKVALANYGPCRDYVLEDREWTFAKGRLKLNQDPVPPAFGFTYQYIIAAPVRVLRVIRCYQDSAGLIQLDDWVREGARILTNQIDGTVAGNPIYAEVLQQVDEDQFSPGCAQALIEYLMSVMAVPLTENRQLAKDSAEAYKSKIIDAGAMDGSQGRTQRLRPPPLRGRLQNL